MSTAPHSAPGARPGGPLAAIAPSPRPHGAQRMFSATTLTLEALVSFFAVLVAHQLVPDQRGLTWAWGLGTALALALCAGLLRRGAWAYVLGALLQVPVVLLGLQVPAMWVVGGVFAVLYVYGVVKGHQLDAEKDAVDRRVLAGEDPAAGEGAGDPDPRGDGPTGR